MYRKKNTLYKEVRYWEKVGEFKNVTETAMHIARLEGAPEEQVQNIAVVLHHKNSKVFGKYKIIKSGNPTKGKK